MTDGTIVVTGGAGFLGSFVVEQLVAMGVPERRIVVPRSRTHDLRTMDGCERAVKGAATVIHLAGNVGGIGYNRERPGELFYDNVMMGAQLMEAARRAGVTKFVAVGTVCAYPRDTAVPFRESDLWSGYPETTNAPYGLAKKMLLVQAEAYRQQFGFNAIYVLPTNLYGPRDHFEPERSHVIPALIRKVALAEARGDAHIDVWGSGHATREFCYVADAADAIVLATDRYDAAEPVNIGSGQETTIRDLTATICDLMDFQGEVRWDASKTDGQPRRWLDTTRAERAFGFRARTSLTEGLTRTIAWYRAHANTV